ncbi:regulator of protease activity HflC (stomatin/prohibitin superfamily) [Paenibacillus sp. V4I3]|nr:regulator of protease activity HflC (stomatin/prohibitin superfamily) [Paenibacillus sp. V4I3]
MKKVALYIFVFAIIVVFIFWFAFSLFLHKSDEWWSIFEFEHIGSDVTIAKISWLKVLIIGMISVIIGFVSFKNHHKQ